MEWTKEFYHKQGAWTGCYSGDVTDFQRRKMNVINKFVGSGVKNILELGAGGGQNAVAAAELGHHVTAIELVPSVAAIP